MGWKITVRKRKIQKLRNRIQKRLLGPED